MPTVKQLGLVLLFAVLSACSDDAGSDGLRPARDRSNQSSTAAADCAQQVRVGGRVFTSHGYTQRRAVKHAAAEMAECRDTGPSPSGLVFPDPPVPVETWTFSGYPPEKVLGVESVGTASFAVFVADAVPPAERDRIYDELSRSPEVCPDRLAQASSETNGFGTTTPARTAPRLPRPSAGIVCAYSAHLATRNAEGAQFRWNRVGDPVTLSEEQRDALAADLAELKPPPESYACTSDLGPRWLLVYRSASGVVGVVVDDFGCREVRLTTDPAGIVAGEDPDPGLVRGVLFGPRLFEQRLDVIAGEQLRSR